jgi:hypothetical protein
MMPGVPKLAAYPARWLWALTSAGTILVGLSYFKGESTEVD